MQLISNMMIAKTIHIWPLKNTVERKKTFVLFFKYEEQVIWVPKETYWQILSSSNDPKMWILRRAHTWQIHPQGKENFIFYQISQRSDDLVLRWLTSRGTPNVSAAPLARNPSGRSALSRTGIFKITTNYHYHVEPLQRCVLPRGLLPQIRHQVRWLPGGDRAQLSGRN